MPINELPVWSFILSIKIRLLKTKNALFRVIRPLLSLVNAEALYDFDGPVTRPMRKPAFREDKKAI